MANKKKKNKQPWDQDSGTGNPNSVSPQATVFMKMKPKKNLGLVADEYENRFGGLPSGQIRIQAKAYNKSLTTGGSGDPTKPYRKKRHSA